MNLTLIYLMYGLTYFTMGTVVLVKIIPLIDDRLARIFGWLVAFGFVHAFHEWIEMFQILGYTASILTVVDTLMVALSFAVLLQFGLEFINIKKDLSASIRIIPTILFVLWLVYYLKALSYEDGMKLAEIGSRYSLGFLGTFLTAYALIRQRKSIAKDPYISKNLLFAGIFFGLYGIFTIVVPDSDFFPASIFNYSWFTGLMGVPVQIFRMLCALVITGFIVRSLDVFNVLEKKKLAGQVKEITGALEESEEEFRSLVENSPNIIIIASPQGTIRFINRTVPGFSIEKVLGTSVYDYVPKKHHATMKKSMEFVCQTKEPDSYEIIGKGPHDTMAWYATRIMPVKQNDKVVALTFVSTDITKRKQAEERIERNYNTQKVLNALLHISMEDISFKEQLERAIDIIVSVPFMLSKQQGGIFLVDDDLNTLALKAHRNLPSSLLTMCARVSFGHCLCGRSAKTGEIQFADHIDNRHENMYEKIVPHGHYVVPILSKRKTLGVIVLYLDEGHKEDRQEIEFLQLVAQTMAGIIERKQSDARILRQRALLDGINKVFRETLTCETAEEVADTCLSVAEKLTGSKFGWIGIVNQSGRLDIIALSTPGWEVCEMLISDAEAMIKDMEIRGIWGRVLKDRQSLIVNDPTNHPDSVGTPEGHTLLTSFLGIPLKRAGETIGMFALANKESGYNLSDQQDMEALSIAFVEALDRKWAEEALKDSEAKYRSLFESANDAIIIFEPENEIILEANTKVYDIYGYSRDELIKMSLKDISKDVTTGEKRIRLTLKKGALDNFETIHIKKDGTPVNILINASVIKYEGQQAILSINRDITGYKRVEEALRKSEEKFRNLFDHASDSIFIHDLDGHFLEVNKMACKHLGYSKEKLLQITLKDIDTPEYRALVPERIKELRQKGRIIFESAHVRKDGKIIPVEINSQTIDYNGEPAVLSIARDITDRKQAEEALKHSEEKYRVLSEQLLEANNMKELLLDVISHDLRNPAGVISGMTDLMLEDFPDNEMVELIKSSSDSLLQVMKSTTLLTKVTLGEEIEKEDIDLARVIKKVVKQFLPTLKEKNMTLENRIPDVLLVKANPIIEEVFNNYISNAIKYASKGKRIIIEASVDDKFVSVGVKDFGESIPHEEYDNIFIRKTQLRKENKHGWGLGLAIVKRIAAALNGDAWVEANKPKGNIFYIKIPKA